jgi:hypothetical protein
MLLKFGEDVAFVENLAIVKFQVDISIGFQSLRFSVFWENGFPRITIAFDLVKIIT